MPALSFPDAATDPAPPERRSILFLLVYALANAGAVIGYLPLLTLLLPIKTQSIAGDARMGLFTATIVAGAVAASVANILFGWLSDRTLRSGGGRRSWMAAGVAGTAAAYALVAAATTPTAIFLAIVAFQFAINALLAPLVAILAEEIPDTQKGLAGGLLLIATPIASALSAGLVGAASLDERARLAIIAAAVMACTLPLLLVRARRVASCSIVAPMARARRDLALAWIARLMMQIAGSVLSLYMLYYFQSVATAPDDPALPVRVGHLLMIAFAIPLPIALILGRVSDRTARRKPFLFAAALLAAGGLVLMATAGHWIASAVGFCLHAIGSSVFLALHAAFATQLLPDPAHRGRDLGLLNLTNTLPALVGPALAWLLAAPDDFTVLMLVLAALTSASGLVILAVSGRR